jgi:hypothetical protein
MVARGDLGVELALEDVPVAQKTIIRAARRRGAPVIVANPDAGKHGGLGLPHACGSVGRGQRRL